MRFTFLTLFPNLIFGYFGDSILKRAILNELIDIEVINIRDFSQHKYKKVDNFQVGGGAGLVLCADVLSRALETIITKDTHVIYLTPVAKRFVQNDAKRLALSYSHIVFICGRYEGIDERIVEELVDEVFCIGDFILTGGELPSLCLCDAIVRNINLILGNPESLIGESFENDILEAPVFTKQINKKQKKIYLKLPSEYSKGNHGRIKAFKYELSLCKTKYFRPDIYQNLIQRGNNAK